MFTVLRAQGITDKQQQLEILKEKIGQQERIIKNREKDKSNKQADLTKTKKKQKDTENQIKRLSESEEEAKNKLNATIDKINKTDLKIEDLDLLCELEFNNLFISHFDKKHGFDEQFDPLIIAAFIENTVQEMKNTLGFKDYLIKEKQKKHESYESFAWSLTNSKKTKNQYQRTMRTLESDLTTIEKERLSALKRKQMLEQEASALDELISQLQSKIMNEDFSYEFSNNKLKWPVQGEVIRTFGFLKAEQYKVSLKNDGIDIAIDEGTPVEVVDDGIVAFAEWYEGAGKMVIIDHHNGFYSLYSHNSLLLVSKGENVYRGQEIALSGKSGSADCACLHFEIRKGGIPVNPLDFLE